MRAVMYHYVRPNAEGMPHFRYLALEDFRAQLDHFAARFGFVSQAALSEALRTGAPPDGVVLTFDDAMHDHYDFVLPELVKRGLWGIFYVPTGVYTQKRMLDVHRVHVLLGRHGGAAVLDHIAPRISADMVPGEKVAAFRDETYTLQDNDAATDRVKRILNYFLRPDLRVSVLNEAMEAFFGDAHPGLAEFYVTPAQLEEMAAAGMVIGSHSVSHPVFSTLSRAAQEAEIASSFAFLEPLIAQAPFRSFCYPYGGFHSFTAETEALLEAAGCDFSFNVEQRCVSARDLSHRRQALPRFDCNRFAHGTASMG